MISQIKAIRKGSLFLQLINLTLIFWMPNFQDDGLTKTRITCFVSITESVLTDEHQKTESRIETFLKY